VTPLLACLHTVFMAIKAVAGQVRAAMAEAATAEVASNESLATCIPAAVTKVSTRLYCRTCTPTNQPTTTARVR